MSAEALRSVTVALRQSGHTPLASPHESPANSRPQFLQFANGRGPTTAYANSKKGDHGTSVRLVFLTTNAAQRHYLRHLSNLIPRSKCCATAAIVLLLHGVGPTGQSGRARSSKPVLEDKAVITGNARPRPRRCLLKPVATTSTFPQQLRSISWMRLRVPPRRS